MENFSLNSVEDLDNGIPIELLLSEIDKSTLETITCPICLDIVWDPVDCSKCGFIFCENCIDESIEKVDDSCPICKNSPFQTTECKTIKKLLAKFKFRCPNIPCDVNPEYSDFLDHLEKCKFRKYHCNNKGCDFETIEDDKEGMENHSKICEYKLINCQYCSKSV